MRNDVVKHKGQANRALAARGGREQTWSVSSERMSSETVLLSDDIDTDGTRVSVVACGAVATERDDADDVVESRSFLRRGGAVG